jgi:hypothetical protein
MAKKKEPTIKDSKEVAKALEVLFATEHIDRKKLLFENFLRGMAFSVGGIIGATILIGLLIWILSVFDNLPVVGPLFEDTKQTIERNDK